MDTRKVMKRAKKKVNIPNAANIVTGIAWYSSEQWVELRRVVSDPAELESTYEEWQYVIKRSVPDLINAGFKLLKVPVEVSDLVDWCRHRDKPIDADARAEYVLELLKRRGASSFETITNRTLQKENSRS